MALNLATVLKERAAKQPSHAAILGPKDSDSWSYADLWKRIEASAAQLSQAGVNARSCVGLHVASGREYIVWTYALWQCGAVSVPIAVELAPEEKRRIGAEIAIDWVITPSDQADFLPQQTKSAALSDGLSLFPVKRAKEHPKDFFTLNPAFLRFTSGTTGMAKGVILSHDTIHARITAANEVLKIGPADNIVWLLSMSYHFAVSIVAYLSFGATILLPSSYLGAAVVQVTARQKGTFIYGSPMHYSLMAADTSGARLDTVRLAISTTTALDGDIAAAFHKRFGIGLSQAYGIIEVGLPCINHDDPAGRPQSVGKPLPAYQLQLEDSGQGEQMQHIKIRGPGFFDGYYEPWTPRGASSEIWFATGDLGHVDDKGYLFICGRSKEVINIAGMKFFPREVESVLCLHPAIEEACVVALHDSRFGEIPQAYVTCRNQGAPLPTPAELREFCLRHLAPYKVPLQFFFVQALAKTASGKLIHSEQKQREFCKPAGGAS